MDLAEFIEHVNKGKWNDGYAVATMEFDIKGGFHADVDILRPRLTPTGYDVLVNGKHHHTFNDVADVVKVFTGHSMPYATVFRLSIFVKLESDVVPAQRLLQTAKELCNIKKIMIDGDVWSPEGGIVTDIDTSFKPPVWPIRTKLRALMCIAA
jgi:hypothetical protein